MITLHETYKDVNIWKKVYSNGTIYSFEIDEKKFRTDNIGTCHVMIDELTMKVN